MNLSAIQSEVQDIKRKFDAEQPRWEEIYHRFDYDSKGFQWRQQGAIDLCLKHVPLGGWILDLGCGCGNASVALAKLGFDVLGADISEPMISQAARNAELMRAANCRFEVFDFSREHPAAGRFQAVVALGFIEYFDDPLWVLRRMHHLLRSDGVAIVQIWNRRTWSDRVLKPAYGCFHAVRHPIDASKDLAQAVLPRRLVERLRTTKPAGPARREPQHRRYTPAELHDIAGRAGFRLIDARASRFFPCRFMFSNERRIRWDEQLQHWSEHKRFVRDGAIDYIAALRKV